MDPVGSRNVSPTISLPQQFLRPSWFSPCAFDFFLYPSSPSVSGIAAILRAAVITRAAEARDRRGRDDAEELYARNLSSAIPRREKENESFVLLGSALLSLLAQPHALGATLPMKTLVNGARGILPWRSGLVGAGNEREMTRECNEPSAVVTAARSYWSG